MPFRRAFLISLEKLRLWAASARSLQRPIYARKGEPGRAGGSGTADSAQSQARVIEEQLAKIAGAAMDAIISVDERQRIVMFNPAAETMFGFTADEAMGQPLEMLIPQRFRQAHVEHVRRFMKEGTTARRMGALGQLAGLRANGEEFPIEASLSRVTDPDAPVYTAIVRDVTERVQSERLLRSFIDDAPVAIAMFDRNMRYLAASRRWLEDYGLTASVTGRSHFDMFPVIPKRLREVYRRALAGETIKAEEDFFKRADAPSIWVKWEIRPWYLAKGAIGGVILFSEDTTARKKAEEALRHSEGQFRGVYERAGTGIAIASTEGQFAACNPAFASMLGYAEDELRSFSMLDLMHAEDRDANVEGIGRLLRGETSVFEASCRCLRKDGDWLWAEKTISLLRDADGKPSNILMLLNDRTERQRAEERKRMLTRELAHRGRNLLAVIQSITKHSLLNAASLEEALTALTGRLQALAHTYGSLTGEAFEGAKLDGIVSAELQPFSGRGSAHGPKIMLGAKIAQTFALVVHELATNAAKYDALSVPGGRVDVTWKAAGAGSGRRFLFEWAESGGPSVSPPARRGFGTTLVSLVAGAEFDCAPELVYSGEGFRYRFDAPLAIMGAAEEEAL